MWTLWGATKRLIAEYIRKQLEEDYASDQMTLKEYYDPFTGDKNNKKAAAQAAASNGNAVSNFLCPF